MKKVIIDVDGTLFDFGRALYSVMSLYNPRVEPPYRWFTWNTPKESFGNNKLFFQIVDGIHRQQIAYTPFPLAGELLKWLFDRYEVVIATHRKPIFKEELEAWLLLHDLPADDVICTKDKTELFDDSVVFVFDDKGSTLAAATAKGIRGYSLYYPYNRGYGSRKFDNIGHFLGYLMSQEDN